MNITHHVEQGGARLALDGELDVATADLVRDHIDRALTLRPDRLTLDLTALAFCDSAGVAALGAARTAAYARGTRFEVVNVTGMPRQVMRLMGVLDDLTSGV